MLPVIKINSCLEPFFKLLCTLCLVLMSHTLLACWSSEKYYDWHSSNTQHSVMGNYFHTNRNPNVKKIKSLVGKYEEMGLNGFPPSEELVKNWTEWYDNYKKHHAKDVDFMTSQNKDRLQAERGPDSGWPTALQWADLGEGYTGAPVPPWAYTLKPTGLPQACMQPIQKDSTCFNTSYSSWKRGGYGYNPYVGTCIYYESYGCQYNINFFHNKEYCIEYCTYSKPTSFCNQDTNVPIDYTYIFDQK